jgi:hypothetical protein
MQGREGLRGGVGGQQTGQNEQAPASHGSYAATGKETTGTRTRRQVLGRIQIKHNSAFLVKDSFRCVSSSAHH